MSELFSNIPNIKYEGVGSENPLAFKFYDPSKIVMGKPMKEQLKFAMSYWHTLCGTGADMFGVGTADKRFGGNEPMEIAKKKVVAGFEIMQKLGIEYFAFHDYDIAPEGETLAQSNSNLDAIADLIVEKMNETGIKCLWGTAKLFDNKRYMHGAGTAPNADVFAYAAAQVKKAIELSVKFKASGYVFWGGREGYETLINTDMKLEQDNMARLMHMAVDYARSLGFKGDFYIEPKPKEPTKHQYDFDAATAVGFLRHYGLDKDFKLNIEANHATLAGHTFQHEIRVGVDALGLGSIDANQGDMLLGWDTDQFPTDVYNATYCMLEILKAGGFTNGGLNFDSKARRGSFTVEDIFYSYIAGMDTFALGLIKAAEVIEDGRVDKFVEKRYESWKTGIGADIISGKATLAELEKYSLAMGDVTTNISGRQEYLESAVNQVIFK